MSTRNRTPDDVRRDPTRPDRRNQLIAALLALCTLAAFFPLFQNGFVTYDDPGYVYENPHVRAGLTPGTMAWAFTTFQESNWHPLTWISHALDVTLFGVSAPWHHAMSLLLHLISTVLLFVALERMTGERWPSAFVALVFGIHPLHVESVAWLSERKDVLSGLFLMLTLLSYENYVRTGERGARLRTIAFYALGLLAKPMLVTVPFVLLLLDYWPLGRMGLKKRHARPETAAPVPAGKLLAEKLPLFLLAAASSVVTFIAQERGGAIAEAGPLAFADRAANAVTSWAGYIVRTFVPTGLAFFYPHRMSAITATEIGLSGLLLAAASAAAWRLRRSRPWLFTGWALYLGTLVPVIGLVQVGLQAMADRYMYLPQTGLAIIVAWGVSSLLRSPGVRSAVAGLGFAAAAAGMGALTWNQAQVWRSSESLYRHALAVTSGNHVAHTNLGVLLADAGRDADAIPHFREALRLWPRNTRNLANLARSLGGAGQYEEALRHYRAILPTVRPDARLYLRIGDVFAGVGEEDSALAYFVLSAGLDSAMIDAHLGIADILSSRSDFAGARESVRRIFMAEPGSSRGHDMLGIVAGRQGMMEEAEEEFGRAIAADSLNDQARIDLGILYEKTGRGAKSRGEYEAAVRANPRSANARLHYGLALARDNDLAGAEREWKYCLELAPPAVEARMNLARLYTMQRQGEKAAAQYSAVLASNPSRADVHYLLGNLLAGKGDTAGSAKHYREALRIDSGFSEAATALGRLGSGDR